MILFSGKPAVLPGEILWPGPAGAAAGGKRETFFRDELGAWGGGEEDPGGCCMVDEPRRGERSEREGRPVADRSRPRRAEPYLLLGPPRPPAGLWEGPG